MVEPIGPRSLRELTRIIFSRLVVVIVIIALITVGTLIVCLKAPNYYSSSVTFLVKEPRPQNPTVQTVPTYRSLEVFIKTQHEIITSQTVLARTWTILTDPKSSAAVKWQSARQAWQEDSSEENWQLFLQALKELDQEAERRKTDPQIGERFRSEIRQFAKAIEVEIPGGAEVTLSEIFTVSVVQPGPPLRAQNAADCLAKNYVDRYREVQATSSRNAVQFMRGRLASLKQQRLLKAEAALRNFVEKELDSPSDVGILEQLTRAGTEAGRQITVRRFNEEIILIDGGLAEASQQKRQLLEQLPKGLWEPGTRLDQKGELTVPDIGRLAENKLPDNDPILTDIVTIIPETTLKNNVIISQLKAKEVSLLIELNRLKVEYNDEYRGVRDKLTEISRTRRQILRELIGEASSLDIKIATLAARKDEFSRKLEQELKRLDRITTQLVRYQELQNEVALAREEYRKVSSELASALTFQEQEADAITINIVDDAKLPDVKRPVYPRTVLYTLIAAVVGLLLAMAYAFLADHFDHTLGSIEETERYLGVPVIGSIEKGGKGLLT
ncbi:MAG: hypothetical protein JSV03_15545 [Planctomycetota bacterium]|nr:MAG: hypothetical protein JSV03_15545 [Planctomycetota bacterium]